MAYEWLRLYKDVRNDPKLQTLPPELFRQLINIWTVAADGKPYGRLPKDLDSLGWVLRKTPKELTRILDYLREQGLLDEDEETGLLLPHNWDVRQHISDHTGADRTRAFRERQRELGMRNGKGNVLSNVLGNVTDNVSCDDQDTDTDTDTDLDIILSPRLSSNDKHNLGGRGVTGGPASAVPPGPPAPAGSKPKKERTGNRTPKKGTTLPANFRAETLIEPNIRWALETLPGATLPDLEGITDAFILRAERDGTVYKNWLAAWKYWVRNEKKWGKYGHGKTNGSGSSGAAEPGRPTSIGKPNDQLAGAYADLLGGSVPRTGRDSGPGVSGA